ncbi:MAG: hypothetical protein ACYCTC_12855 [Acidithiobacillus ferrooxidans]
MSYAKQSVNDDERFRLSAKAVIILRGEKLAGIARALQFDPGGLSGWLGGTPNRLSVEKKELLSTYLGLEYTHISPMVVHRWTTCIEDISTYLPIIVNKELLLNMSIRQITSNTIPIGSVYYSTIRETNIVILCKPKNKAFPIPVVSPEITGWGNLLPPIEITKSTWELWWSDQHVSPEKIAGHLFRSSE